MSKRKKKTLWAVTVGTKPCRVRVFERTKGGPLWLRYWDPEKAGRFKWEALKHNDRDKAEAEALEVAARLKRGEKLAAEGATTLATLFVAYERHRTPRKSRTEQKADARRIEMWTRVLGAEKVVDGITLGEWERFIDERRSGVIDARGHSVEEENRRPVRDRVIEADTKWLQLVAGWATKWRGRNGRYLLTENPLRGYPIPKERNPRQPVASTDRLEALQKAIGEAVAERDAKRQAMMKLPRKDRKRVLDPVGDLSEFLDIAAGTGRRLSAVCNLRWEDVILERTPAAPHGAIRWRAAHDKSGKESTVPIGPQVRAAIDRLRQRRPGVGEAPLFSHPKDPSKPVTRHEPSRWLQNAEKLAGLEPQKGSLWHAYRRAWATQRKHLPAVDVAKAGGWATVQVVQQIYTQADEETTLKVVLDAAEIREVRS